MSAGWMPTVGAKYLDISRPRWVEVEVTEVSAMCAQLGDDGRFVLTCFDPDHPDYRFQPDPAPDSPSTEETK